MAVGGAGMTLDEAIERYTNNAEYESTHSNLQGCLEFRQLAEWLKELKAYKEQDSAAISNLAMYHILNHEVKWINERMTTSVTSQPKNGRWVKGDSYGDQYNYYQSYVCSCCKHEYDVHGWNYCPNYGAKMQEVKENA